MENKKLAISDEKLRNGVLSFYRNEIEQRYQLGNVRRFKQFETIPDDRIELLRDFFLNRIYPVPNERKKLDNAFDRLSDMLTSPRRMKPLMGAALSSMWRMGTKLPAAVSAGRSTIDAFMETRELEALLIEAGKRQNLTASAMKDRTRMIALLNNVPEKHVLQLITNVLNLFNALTNVDMLRVAVKFMQSCESIMDKHGDLYTEEDAAGIALGRELIERGIELFEGLSNKDFRNIIGGIQQVEMDWYRKVQAEAAEAA